MEASKCALAEAIHIGDFDVVKFQVKGPAYLRNIITTKEDGQTNKILSGEM